MCSVVAVVIGMAALCWVTPIAIGIGLTLVGAVGALTSGYGLFTQSLPDRHELSKVQVVDEGHLEGASETTFSAMLN